jgi:capsular exopolysaccharide synthesis family protein
LPVILALFFVADNTIILPPNGADRNGNGASYQVTMLTPKRRYLSYLRERWWVVMLAMAFTISTMLIYETIRTGKFTSFAQIYLTGNVQLGEGNFFSEEALTYYGTQVELLKSARLQSAAYEKAGIVIPRGGKNPYKIEVVQPLKTSILVLQVTGPDPGLTQNLLAALVDGYLSYKKETRISTSEDLVLSLNDELNQKETTVKELQDKWLAFQRTNNVGALEAEAKSAGLYLSDLDLQLAKLEVDRDLLAAGLTPEADNKGALMTTNAGGELDSNEVMQADSLIGTQTSTRVELLKSTMVQLALKKAERERARSELAARGLGDIITNLQQTVALLEQQSHDEIKAQLAETDHRIEILKASIPNWQARLLDVDTRLTDGQKIQDEVKREQAFYDHLMGTLQNVDLGKNVQQERLSVLQPATPAEPEKRYLALRILLAGFAGLLLALGLVFGWYLLDDRFVSVRDIKDQFGEKILGLVPQIKTAREKPQGALLANGDGRRAYVESYRHLRSALLLSSFGENRPQVLLITSAAPGEGKTTIAINLARLLARSGLRVVLVDTDVCGGGMNRLLGNQEQPGVLDYLRGEAEAAGITYPTEFDGLSFVPGGTQGEHSEGLFLRPRLNDLIQELRQNRDFVILDGAPILAADDTALLVPQADAIVLVTRPFYTHSRSVRQALDMLYQRQAKHVSIILNRARADDLAGHYATNGFSQNTQNIG